MKRVVTFARVSTQEQDTDRQIDITNEYCKVNGFDLINHYEEKISGKKDRTERKILSEMLDFVMNKENNIYAIIILEISRLGRNLIDVLTNVRDLKENGICVIAIQNGIITLNDDGTENPTAKLMLGVLGSVAEIERTRILTASRTGLKEKIINQKHAFGGVAPYGYERRDKMFIVNEDEAKLVRLVFNLYEGKDGVEGVGCKKIAEIINNSGFETRFKKLKKNVKYKDNKLVKSEDVVFTDRVIYSILKNQLYKGIRVYKEKNSNNEIVQTHYINQPAIISVKQFDDVQVKLKSKYNKTETVLKYNYIIEKGSLKCGICGRNYFPHMRSNGKDSAYKCLSTRLGENCGNYNIGINKLTSAIWYFLRRTDALKQQLEETKSNSTLKNEILLLQSENIEINKNIEILKKKKKKLLDYLSDRIIEKDEYIYKKVEINNKIEKLLFEYQSKTNKIDSLQEFEKQLENLNDLDSILRNIKKTPSELQKLFKKLIRKIDIYPVRGGITLEQGKINGIDKILCANLFLNTGILPITFLFTQRTNLLVILEENEFDFQNFVFVGNVKNVKKDAGRGIKRIIHLIKIEKIIND